MTQSEPVKRNGVVFIQKKWVQAVVLAVIGVIFYLLLGQEWISIQDDTAAYLQPTGITGVMPVYPMFLFGIKSIFGESLQLDMVVIIQSVIAIICTMIFSFYIQQQFRLKFAETVLIYIACMLPFSIYLPETGITHQILTEGLCYALFYPYFLFLLHYTLTKRTRYLAVSLLFAVLLALTRSQLLFLLIVTALDFVIVESVKDKTTGIVKKILKVLLRTALGIGGILIIVIMVYKVLGLYLTYQLPVIQERKQEAVMEEDADEQPGRVEADRTDTRANMSQMTALLMIRGFYEADEEDVALFDTEEMREIFRRVYRSVDDKQYRYVYARQDLYMWKDLVCDRIINVADVQVNAYLQENPDVNLNAADVLNELGWRVLWKHFDRYLYHTIRVMISAFIASVFWQIEKIYLLCHIITLFLFLFAVCGNIVCIRNGGNKKVIQFVCMAVGFIVIMVSVICAVFVGAQRYMVYAMGIFYCSMYLLVRELLFILAAKYPGNTMLVKLADFFNNNGSHYGE